MVDFPEKKTTKPWNERVYLKAVHEGVISVSRFINGHEQIQSNQKSNVSEKSIFSEVLTLLQWYKV